MIYFYRLNIQQYIKWTKVVPSTPLKCRSHTHTLVIIMQSFNIEYNNITVKK